MKEAGGKKRRGGARGRSRKERIKASLCEREREREREGRGDLVGQAIDLRAPGSNTG